MDTRNGDIYPSKELALAMGVPDKDLVEVDPEIVVVTSGPFKGRRYERTITGIRRLPDKE